MLNPPLGRLRVCTLILSNILADIVLTGPPSSLFLSLSIPLYLTTYFLSLLSHFPHPVLTGNLWKAVCTVLGTSNSSPLRSLETVLLGFSLNILQKLTLSGLPVTYLLSYAWVDLVNYFQSLDSQDSFLPWTMKEPHSPVFFLSTSQLPCHAVALLCQASFPSRWE